MSVRIRGGNFRDLSYVASRLRPEDVAEVDAQLPGWTPLTLAYSHMGGYCYVAELHGNPEAAFGAAELRSTLWTIWSWGSPQMWRCAVRMRDFGLDVMLPQIVADGATRAEARALVDNRWGNGLLKALGATRRCELPGYGVNGETFVLWDWAQEEYDRIEERRRR